MATAEPVYATTRASLIAGDAMAILPDLPTASVDAVITDPPYNSSVKGGHAQSARKKYVSSDAQHTLPDFAGDQRDQRSYVSWLSMVLSQCLRITKEGGSALVFTDWRQLPSTSDALQAAGWTWRGVIAWHKPITRPMKNGFKASCEYALWGSKGEPIKHAPDIYLPGYYAASMPRGSKRSHITQKPDQLMDELVKICPEGGTILDPFAGSAATGVAALRSGRDFVGIELTAAYAEVSAGRLADAEAEDG